MSTESPPAVYQTNSTGVHCVVPPALVGKRPDFVNAFAAELDLQITVDDNGKISSFGLPASTQTPTPAAQPVSQPSIVAQAASLPSAVAHKSEMVADSKGKVQGLDGATKPQIWALKAYWISYELAILDALVKDMESTFTDSKLPSKIDSMLSQLQPLIDNSNKSARKLCDSTTSIVDKQGKS